MDKSDSAIVLGKVVDYTNNARLKTVVCEESDLPRPAPPVVGKVTHHSIEMYWDESMDKAVAVCDMKTNGRIRICLQEHDRGGEWGNLYSKSPNYTYIEKTVIIQLVKTYIDIIEDKKNNSAVIQEKETAWERIEQEYNSRPDTSFRTRKQLKCFWKNEKMRAKEELISLWKSAKPTDTNAGVLALSQFSQSVCSIIPEKIRSLENNYCLDGDAASLCDDIKSETDEHFEETAWLSEPTERSFSTTPAGIATSVATPIATSIATTIATRIATSIATSLATSNLMCTSLPMAFYPSPPQLFSPLSIPTMSPRVSQASTNMTKFSSDYENFLRQIAQTEHEKKMQIYKLKEEILLLKKRKLEKEMNISSEISYLHNCASKKIMLDHALDKA